MLSTRYKRWPVDGENARQQQLVQSVYNKLFGKRREARGLRLPCRERSGTHYARAGEQELGQRKNLMLMSYLLASAKGYYRPGPNTFPSAASGPNAGGSQKNRSSLYAGSSLIKLILSPYIHFGNGQMFYKKLYAKNFWYYSLRNECVVNEPRTRRRKREREGGVL